MTSERFLTSARDALLATLNQSVELRRLLVFRGLLFRSATSSRQVDGKSCGVSTSTGTEPSVYMTPVRSSPLRPLRPPQRWASTTPLMSKKTKQVRRNDFTVWIRPAARRRLWPGAIRR